MCLEDIIVFFGTSCDRFLWTLKTTASRLTSVWYSVLCHLVMQLHTLKPIVHYRGAAQYGAAI